MLKELAEFEKLSVNELEKLIQITSESIDELRKLKNSTPEERESTNMEIDELKDYLRIYNALYVAKSRQKKDY